MKIRFTKAYKVRAEKGEAYKEGQTVEVSDASGQHFIGRGVAEEVAGRSAEPKRAAERPVADDADEGATDDAPDFSAMTKAELLAYAETNGIEGVSHANAKAEILDAVEKASRQGK